MSTSVTMPKMGMTMKEGTISKWFKKEGDAVEKGEVLFEVETEKITNQIESPGEGVLFQIVVPTGTTVPVGTIVGIIAEAGEQPERIEGVQLGETVEAEVSTGGKSSEAEKPAGKSSVLSTPSARRVARELGIDIGLVTGTGPGGKVKEGDVLKFHEEGPPTPGITPLAEEMVKKEGLDIHEIAGTGEGGKITKEDVERLLAAGKAPEIGAVSAVKVIPMKGIRKVIADNMHASLQNAAQLTTWTEVDVTEMVRFRDLMRQKYEKEGVKISYNDIIILATVRALKEHPIMNSTLVGEEILLHKAVHMGIAVALKDGLIVPKIRNAEKKTLLQIAKEARDLAARARKGVLSMDEATGGTFTITNVSMLDMDGFTPVLNPPETGILGVGRVMEKPAVVDGDIVVRHMMTLSLTFDHKVVDGAPAMTFLRDLAGNLREPMLMLA
ncbi:MAG: 2-oxo acid dehydrogenase subunit E2 [Deltaproteobacteria bacterium]|nr:2-oxo acid dehydrogenase subunit E2 [Deltaproteobacteria bacterium]